MYLGLASCNLSQIPRLLRNQNSLIELDLSNNKLHGIVPSWLWGNFILPIHQSVSLKLSKNMITSVENLPSCPDPLSSCRYFTTIDLSHNKIRALPIVSGTYLDYSNNEFFEIPSNYSLYLDETKALRLSTNRLTGVIPSFICELPNLQFLDLSNNSFSGIIPSCLLGSPNMRFMNLASNKFHGIVPRNISKSCELLVLDLSNNNLDGDLPKSLTSCKDLVLFSIGNNNITDTFPFWMWELTNLQVIILSSNHLHGTLELPSRFTSNNLLFQNLRIIDLASNDLNGSLPPLLFKNFRSMANLSLNEKTVEGFFLGTFRIDVTIINKGIEMTLAKLIASIMLEIDLSNNKFTGDIPETLGTLSALRALNLSHNVLTGIIPSAFKGLNQIESLDLSWNNLTGEIPQELSSLHSLSKLNLSYNNLEGRIPQSVQFSTFTYTSFEGNPGLCGFPLSQQCNATSLKNNSISNTLPMTNDKKLSSFVLLCLLIGLGFGTGLVIVIVWPAIKRAIKGEGTS